MRIRFSLGTLVLVVLLIASTAVFWWNLEQWRPVATFEVKGKIRELFVLRGQKTFCVYSMRNEGMTYTHCISLFDSTTSVRQHYFEAEGSQTIFIHASPDAKYIYMSKGMMPREFSFIKLWHLDSDKEIVAINGELSNIDRLIFTPDSSRVFTFASIPKRWTFREFPSMKILQPLPEAHLSSWDDWTGCFCLKEDSVLNVYRKDASLWRSLELPKASFNSALFSECRKLLIIDTQKGGDNAIFDLDTGTKLHRLAECVDHLSIALEVRDDEEPGVIGRTHLLYVDRHGKSHVYNVVKDKDQILPIEFKASPSFLIDGDYVCNSDQSFNMETNQITCQISGEYSGVGRMRVHRTDDRITTLDIRNGESLGSIARYRWPHEFGSEIALVFPREPAFVTRNENRFTLWRQVMPNRATGALCMPEFWITLALAALLIWHLIRVRREPPRTVHAG